MTTNALRPTHANRTTFPLMVTHLTGTQRQMGAQHGAITRAAGGWEPALEYYPQMAQLMIGGSSKILRRVLTPIVEASLLRLDRARPYELKARTEAFMEALGVDTKIARTLMVMDVLQNLVNTAGRMKLGPFARQLREQAIPACSTLVTWGEASDNGTIRHGRNFDFPGVGVWETAPEVVWCTPSDGLRYAFVTLRGGDVPGVTVFNEAGLVITTHTRFNERIDGSGMGIVDLVHNLVRKARTLDEAETLLRRRPIASSWGLCVTSALDGYSVCFEVSGELIRRLEPGDRESFMAATNRYVHPDLKTQEVTISPAFVRNSDGRYELLRAHANRGALSLADLQRVLGSHEDSEVPGAVRASGGVPAQVLSVHSVVVEPENQKLHISVGPVPTGKGPWVELDWNWRDAPGFAITHYDRDSDTVVTHAESRFDRGDAAKALSAFVEAAAIHSHAGEPWRELVLLEKAVQFDGQAPSFRLLAGGARLHKGDLQGAMEHFETGLEYERSNFYQGQFMLWAARVAQQSGKNRLAAALRRDLLKLKHPLLGEHRAAATREMTDALPLKSLLKTRLNYHLVDLQA